MRTRIGLLFWGILLLQFPSCNRSSKSVYCDNHVVVHPQEQLVDTIKGNLLINGDSIPGIVGIVVTPKLLLTIHDDMPFLFSAYTYDGTKVLTFGTKGHSKREFLTNDLIKQYTQNGYVVVNDVNNSQLKFIDLESTIANKQVCIAKVEDIAVGSLATWSCGEKDNIMIQQLPNNFILLRTGEKYKTKMELFEPYSSSFPIYQCYLCVDASGENIAMPMIYLNQINFYSFKSREKKSISMYANALSPDDSKDHTYYSSVCTDGTSVFALYMNQDYSEAYNTPKTMGIHVFDFNANLKHVYICPQYIYDIACDKDNNLYGLDIDGNIYKYEI